LAAFTLIELLVVIAIIALLAGIGAPLLRGLNKFPTPWSPPTASCSTTSPTPASAHQRSYDGFRRVLPPCPWLAFNHRFHRWILRCLFNLRICLAANTPPTLSLPFAALAISRADQPPLSHLLAHLARRRVLRNQQISEIPFCPRLHPIPSLHDRSFPIPVVNTNSASALLKYLAFNYQGQLVMQTTT